MKIKEVFTVTKYEKDGEEKSIWTRIGTCFTNKDGSFSVKLNALPLDGQLQIRDPYRKEDGPEF